VIEDRLGRLNIKPFSSGIYFYVQRHGSLPIATNGAIRFNKERLNMGGAMDISTGVFTVPKTGIYHFSLAMMEHWNIVLMKSCTTSPVGSCRRKISSRIMCIVQLTFWIDVSRVFGYFLRT